MDLFSSKKPMPLGIDISPSAIKLLELSQQRRGHFLVERYAVEQLPVDAIIEDQIADIQAVSLAIKRALKQSGAKTRRAVIAVPGSSVITKTIQMPAGLSERELESMLMLEAGQYIPFPLDEVSIDFEVLGHSQVVDKIDVFLAASRNDKVNERVAVLQEAGLQAYVVDLESQAIERACSKLPIHSAGQLTAVLDMGAHKTTLYVLQHDKLIYSREQDFGGQQLTDQIHQRYGLPLAEAEIAKRQGNLPQDYAFQILQPFIQKMAQQANHAIQLFTSANPNERLSSLLLAGGAVLLSGAMQAIQRQVSVPLIIANPFHGIKIRNHIKLARIQANAPAMLVAYGLALRGLD